LALLLAALLGAVQGLTEFLPVSSSAHLILARAILGFDAGGLGLAFDVACHVGTLLAVLVFFRGDIIDMLRAAPSALRAGASGPGRLVQLVVLGTLPVVILGIPLSGIEDRLRNPWVSAAMLAIGAVLLFVAERIGSHSRPAESLSGLEAIGIGVAQAIALVPGVSRSGATITVGLFLGLDRERAARFSFLLGAPAILAAAAHAGVDLLRTGMTAAELQSFGVGMAVSAAVGYLAISSLLRYLSRHSLAAFAWYRLALAGSVAVWWLTARG
jgi:undecaprenyl-diphosphatase